jgi:23S rRNA (guanosine2251-2'-O)-methyltransferase
MSQRKQKSGKPGTRPGRTSQEADRKGKSSPIRNISRPGEERRPTTQGERTRSPSTSASQGPERRTERPEGGFKSRPARSDSSQPRQVRDRYPDSRPRTEPAPEQYGKERPFVKERPVKEQRGDRPGQSGSTSYWIFGQHAVIEAIGNPLRKIQRLVRVGDADGELPESAPDRPLPLWEQIDRQGLDYLLPDGAVHQGIAARVAPLPELDLLDICEQAVGNDQAIVVILDQVTDPHNVGAILRSAAAFGALAVILTERHTAPESGTLAKSASGALEHVPLVRVSNLARAMDQLKEAGFWLTGLADEGKTTLANAKLSGKIGLVMGAEGPGLRRLTRDHCDLLARLPTGGAINHLNVSNAAAVALYELARLRE